MKRFISIMIVMLCIAMVATPAFAVGSPTAPNQFVGTSGITANGGVENTDDGGITIIAVGQGYIANSTPTGNKSDHSNTEGVSFYNLVQADMNSLIKENEYYDTSIVDIHLWGNQKDKKPSSFTVTADVKKGDKVIVHHYFDEDKNGVLEAQRIDDNNVVVDDNSITVNGIDSFSLWSFTKVLQRSTGSGNTNSGTPTSGYFPPRTDVK